MIMRNTPAFTMVEEWSRADVGVGATMAPRSQPEKGIMADFVKPHNTRSATTGSTGMPCIPMERSWEISRV